MPYLDKNYTKGVRQELKKRYPDYKFSVRTVDSMSLRVVIREAPWDLLSEYDEGKKYEQINHFHVDDFYEDNPKKKDFLNEVLSIMKREHNSCTFVDGDYGSIPNFYINLQIGEWDRPFKVKN